MTALFSENFHRQIIFAADICERAFDDRIQFFYAKDFIQPFQEGKCKLFREGKRSGNLQDADIPSAEGIERVHHIHSLSGNSFAAGIIGAAFRFREDPVAMIPGKDFFEIRISLLDQSMVFYGEPWEDHPPGGIFDESFRCMDLLFFRILYGHGLISMIDPGGSPEENGRSVLLGKSKASWIIS